MVNKKKIQLRMKVNAEIHYKDEITKNSWEKTGHISRKCYLVTDPPGTVSKSPTSGLAKNLISLIFKRRK